MKYQYVIWDFNGTLLDDVKLCFDLLNKMLSKRGFETVTIEKYKEIFRFPVKEYYRLAGFDFEREPFEVTAVEFIVGGIVVPGDHGVALPGKVIGGHLFPQIADLPGCAHAFSSRSRKRMNCLRWMGVGPS